MSVHLHARLDEDTEYTIIVMAFKQNVCYGGHWGHWVWIQLSIC
jgi:hypothetical protein